MHHWLPFLSLAAVLVDGTLIQSSVSIDLLDVQKSFLADSRDADLSKDSTIKKRAYLLRISLLVGMIRPELLFPVDATVTQDRIS